MTLTLLPAIDVATGRAVRLAHAEFLDEADTVLLDVDPRALALNWQAEGAEWIHLVDLDAAFGRGSNADLLTALIGELDVKVQLSGGIRDDDSLGRALSSGCERVNLATSALDDPAWCARAIATHGERIAVAIDVRVVEHPNGSVEHHLAARGPIQSPSHNNADLWDTIARLDQDGCTRYTVTDVSRDGMLQGPNVDLYRAIARETTTPVIASGGISAIKDLVALAEIAAAGANIEGSIIGKALYAGRFTLPEALVAVRSCAMRL